MNWYYAHDGQEQGPVSEEELSRLARTGVIGASNLVWREGLADWAPLSSAAPQLLPPSPSAPPTVPVTITGQPPGWSPAPQAPPQNYPFQFHGSAGEYFRIWIVNTALTILTLGIYAAWAKVRTRRYFYGHTTLDGANFDYLANPISILKGNLIMGAMGLLYIGSGAVFPPLALVILLLFGVVSPWLIYKAFRFRARNTTYRNLRFSFGGQLGESYVAYLWLALAAPFTLGLIIPYQAWRAKRFFYNNMSFGSSRFQFRVEAGSFYAIYLKMLGFFLLLAVGVSVAAPAVFYFMEKTSASGEQPMSGPGVSEVFIAIATIVGGIAYIAFILGISQYIAVRTTNLCLNSTSVGQQGVRFVSQQRLRDMIGLYLTNLIAIIFTIGLAIPWAKVRLARYRASKTSIIAPAGGLEFFTAGASEQEDALGDAAADVFDMDIGF